MKETKSPGVDSLEEQKPFAFAGLWDSWRNIELGDVLHSCTIITTTPNDLLKPIHNRIPVNLRQSDGPTVAQSEMRCEFANDAHGDLATVSL